MSYINYVSSEIGKSCSINKMNSFRLSFKRTFPFITIKRRFMVIDIGKSYNTILEKEKGIFINGSAGAGRAINVFDGERDENGIILLTDEKVDFLKKLIKAIVKDQVDEQEEKNLENSIREFYNHLKKGDTPNLSLFIDYLENKYGDNPLIITALKEYTS